MNKANSILRLERYHKTTGVLELNVKELNAKNQSIVRELDNERKRAVKAENESRRIRSDLHECMDFIQEV